MQYNADFWLVISPKKFMIIFLDFATALKLEKSNLLSGIIKKVYKLLKWKPMKLLYIL